MLAHRTISLSGTGARAVPAAAVARPRIHPRQLTRCSAAADADAPGVRPMQCLAALAASMVLLAGPAHAEKIGEFNGSGFLFKDTVEVVSLDDPDVEGVTLYLSEFQRNIADKLKKDFFSDPSQASLTCAVTGPVTFKDPKKLSDFSGSEVFSEKKSLNLFQDKTVRIRRLYDAKRDTLIYVSYSTRLSTASDDGSVSGGRYRTSICALKIPPAPAPVVQPVAQTLEE